MMNGPDMTDADPIGADTIGADTIDPGTVDPGTSDAGTSDAAPAAAQPEEQVPAAVTPTYRPSLHQGIPKLARGIVWSDLVREMEEEHVARVARWEADVVPLRPGRFLPSDTAAGIEEAA